MIEDICCQPPSKMSDYLTREFKAQLTTTMDSVLRRSMFEIMKIFENSLRDHQMELVQRGEEIAQLKMKLQTAEVKLSEGDRGGDTGAGMSKSQMKKPRREPESVLKTSGQTCDIPEIDFEVPDDWCAPLGCETVTKQDVRVCPSIRLRQLSIPLWHIPVIKQEVVNCDINSNNRTKGCRRSKRGSSLNKGHKRTQDRSSDSLPILNQGTQCPTIRNDMKILLRDIKLECADLTERPTEGVRSRGRILRGKEQENTLKSKRDERQIAATESKSTQKETVQNKGKKRFFCKFCEKVFDSKFGQSVHARSHKRCHGCRKEFPFPSVLKCHKLYCKKLKKILARTAQSTDPPNPQSCNEEKRSSPRKKLVIKKESAPSSSSKRESSIQKERSTIKHFCVHCNKRFYSRSRLNEHLRVHTGEKPFPCSMCPKKFRVNQSLKKHVIRMHNVQVSFGETNGDLAWTKPLEEIEDNQEDLIPPSKDTSRAIDHNNVKRERSPDKRKRRGWQTMGTRCTNGFTCLVCKMQLRNKYRLTEHFLTHKGEAPVTRERNPPRQTRYNKHTAF